MTNPILQVTTTSGQVLPVLGDAQGRVLVAGGAIGPAGPEGPIGLTGADSTVPGPAGPIGLTGADSTVPGPAGPIGLTGADSTVPGPAGPTGLTGADSTVPGPAGPIGLTGAVDTATSYTFTANQTFAQTQTYPRIPLNNQGSGYTLALSDAGKLVTTSSGNIVVPASIFTAGDVISIYNSSGSDITLTQGGGVTLQKQASATTGDHLIAQYGIAAVLCVASNVFVCSGLK